MRTLIRTNVYVMVAATITVAGCVTSELHAQLCDPVETAELLASDGAAEGLFGHSVAVSGDVALVGALGDRENGVQSGAAYIFRFDGADWLEEAKLTAFDGVRYDRFGSAVAVSGDVAIVSAPSDNGSTGAAYVFQFNGSEWIEGPKLVASDGETHDYFGTSVAISDGTIVVGAGDDDISRGAAYVFRFDGSTWEEEAKLIASDGLPLEYFGTSVAIRAIPWQSDLPLMRLATLLPARCTCFTMTAPSGSRRKDSSLPIRALAIGSVGPCHLLATRWRSALGVTTSTATTPVRPMFFAAGTRCGSKKPS